MFTAFGWRKIPSARTLSIMIFLAGLGLTASVISLLYLSQHLIASKSNEIDQQRSVLSVEGAVQTSVNRVLSLVLVWAVGVKTYAVIRGGATDISDVLVYAGSAFGVELVSLACKRIWAKKNEGGTYE